MQASVGGTTWTIQFTTTERVILASRRLQRTNWRANRWLPLTGQQWTTQYARATKHMHTFTESVNYLSIKLRFYGHWEFHCLLSRLIKCNPYLLLCHYWLWTTANFVSAYVLSLTFSFTASPVNCFHSLVFGKPDPEIRSWASVHPPLKGSKGNCWWTGWRYHRLQCNR